MDNTTSTQEINLLPDMETKTTTSEPNPAQATVAGTPKMKPNWKTIFITLAALILGGVIGAVAGVAYYSAHADQQILSNQTNPTPTPSVTSTPTVSSTPTPTPDAYSGWNTYTNTHYGLSFKYPADYKVTENDNVPDNIDEPLYTIIVGPKNGDPEFVINIAFPQGCIGPDTTPADPQSVDIGGVQVSIERSCLLGGDYKQLIKFTKPNSPGALDLYGLDGGNKETIKLILASMQGVSPISLSEWRQLDDARQK